MEYVIIGNGVAGTAAANFIRKNDPTGKITIFSNEKYPFYSRIRLIDLLAGSMKKEELIIKDLAWYEQMGIDIILDDEVTDIRSDIKTVITASGYELKYDKLLLATGSNCFVPPIPGVEKHGSFTLRRIDDAQKILDFLAGGPKNVVIIGGGVLGLEIGNALRKSGHKITVIEAFERLLPRQMDPDGAKILKKQLEGFGFTIYLGVMTKQILGNDYVSSVKLNDDTEILCDIVIISAGVRPELKLANQLDLKIDKGIIVDDALATNKPDIYAAGDGIIHNNRLYGIWPASEAQGKIVGVNMAGGVEKYLGTTMSNILKVVGINLVSIGDIDPDDKFEQIVFKDPEKFVYKKIVIKDNKIIGAIFYGDKTNWMKVKSAIESGIDISAQKSKLQLWDLSVL